MLAGTHVRDLVVTFHVGVFVARDLHFGDGEFLVFCARDARGAALVLADGT